VDFSAFSLFDIIQRTLNTFVEDEEVKY